MNIAVAFRTTVVCLLFALSAGIANAQTAPLDPSAEPKNLPSAKALQTLWDAYKHEKVCFGISGLDPGAPFKVPTLTVKDFSAVPWQSPTAQSTGAPECSVGVPSLRATPSIPAIKLDETYGARVASSDHAIEWFITMTTYTRLTNDPVARGLLKDAIVDWAKNKSLGKGIHVSWGYKPVDYQMMSNILAVLSATAVIAGDFTANDRVVVGPWLNDLVKQSAASYWLDREDNKSFMRTYIAMLWGLVVGDNRPVQDAILEYKLAVHYMRPDGSWPIDSQREQRGLHYDSAATSHLVTIATALQAARGIDLFSYAVDGRSVATAVDFVVASIKDPGTMNKKYAIACPDGGHLNDAGIDHPDLNQYDEAGYLIAYAERFPDRDSSKFILDHYSLKMSMWSEKNGGAPQCVFALAGGGIKRAALVAPPPLTGVLKPKLIVHPHEEIAHGDGKGQINSLIQGNIEDAKSGVDFLNFNIAGTYLAAQHGFTEMSLIIANPLNAKDEATARQCGANIETWDDGKHLSIPFTAQPGGYATNEAKCLSAIGGKVGAMTKLLFNSFSDIAVGFVSDGTIAAIKDPDLQEFFNDVATGKVTVAAAAS